MKKTKDLTEGNLAKNFILFSIPLILSAILSQAYSTIDMIIAGRYIGDHALGAIGATSSFDILLTTLFAGFAVGFSVYVGRLFGEKNYRNMKIDIVNVLVFISAVIVATGVLCIVFCDLIFSLLKVDPEIAGDGKLYFIITKAGYLFIIINIVLVQIYNALGFSAYPFFMSILTAVLNVGGNILAVVVLDLGILGLAWATVLSSAVVTVCYIRRLKLCFDDLGIPKEPFKFRFACVKHSLRYSLPACLQQGSMYLSGLAIAPAINAVGADATTGYSVITKVIDINATVYQNSSKAVSSCTAQSIGAQKYENILKGLFVGLAQCLLSILPTVLLCSVFAEPVCLLFFDDGFTGEALNYATNFSKYYLPFIFFNAINNLGHSFLRGMGDMATLIWFTVFASVVRVIATFALVPSMAMQGVFLGLVISWVAEVFIFIILYLVKYRNTALITKQVHKILYGEQKIG